MAILAIMLKSFSILNFLLEVPFKFQYTNSMKNKNNSMDRLRSTEINLMNEDDKSMHIFYTLEEIEEVIKSLHKVLRTDDPTLGQRLVQLENITDTLMDILVEQSRNL